MNDDDKMKKKNKIFLFNKSSRHFFLVRLNIYFMCVLKRKHTHTHKIIQLSHMMMFNLVQNRSDQQVCVCGFYFSLGDCSIFFWIFTVVF